MLSTGSLGSTLSLPSSKSVERSPRPNGSPPPFQPYRCLDSIPCTTKREKGWWAPLGWRGASASLALKPQDRRGLPHDLQRDDGLDGTHCTTLQRIGARTCLLTLSRTRDDTGAHAEIACAVTRAVDFAVRVDDNRRMPEIAGGCPGAGPSRGHSSQVSPCRTCTTFWVPYEYKVPAVLSVSVCVRIIFGLGRQFGQWPRDAAAGPASPAAGISNESHWRRESAKDGVRLCASTIDKAAAVKAKVACQQSGACHLVRAQQLLVQQNLSRIASHRRTVSSQQLEQICAST